VAFLETLRSFYSFALANYNERLEVMVTVALYEAEEEERKVYKRQKRFDNEQTVKRRKQEETVIDESEHPLST
jgi:hypothetical protein